MKWSTYWLYKLFLWFFRKWVPPSALRREEPSSRRTPPQSSSRSSQKYENHVNHDLQRSTPPTNGNGHRVQHEYVDAHSDNIFRKVSTMYILINFNFLSYCVENFENFKIVEIITSCFSFWVVFKMPNKFYRNWVLLDLICNTIAIKKDKAILLLQLLLAFALF